MKFVLYLNVVIILFLFSESGFSQAAARGDIVINEVLFNPPADGYDYVEGYNRSESDIDLRGLMIANRNSTGDVAGQKQVSPDSMYLPPGGYFVITANEKWLRQHYNVPHDVIIFQISSLPSFPDDKGTIVLLNSLDSIIDELTYSKSWHFSLITNTSGVALERINYRLPAQDSNSWTSASAASGYGTPGYKNSQYQDELNAADELVVPHLFSPDNDGVSDIELIQFRMKEPGFVANAIIYELSGRKVRYLIKNEPIGVEAIYKWDGLDERSMPLPQGIYILITEVFNLNGKTKKFKNVVTLARK